MPDKFEGADLLSIEEAVPTRAAVCRLRQPESLVEADCVDADFRQFRRPRDVYRFCHPNKDKPWS
jgi:hypothetical protein